MAGCISVPIPFSFLECCFNRTFIYIDDRKRGFVTFVVDGRLWATDAEISVNRVIRVIQMIHFSNLLVCNVKIPRARVNGVFAVIFVQILSACTRQQAIDIFSLAENLKWGFVLCK